jgi:MFS family permease
LAAEAEPVSAAAAASGRVILALIVGQLGLHSAMAGLRMAAPLQALREGYSAWSVGLLLALFAAAPVLLALHAGRLADRHGYHRPVHIAVALAVLGMVLAVASTFVAGAWHFGLLCAAATLAGSGANMGMLTIQRTAGLAARDATERVRLFSWLGIAPSFANVVGPVAVGLTIDAAGFTAGYLLLLALPFVSLWSARRVPRLPAPPRPEGAAAASGRTWDLLAAPGMARLLAVNWLLSMCWDVHSFAVPILGHERGFSAGTIGLILGSFTLSVSAVRLLIPALAHRLDEIVVLRSAMVGTALVFLLYPLAPTPWLMAGCAVLLGLTLGCVQPMVMSTLHHITPDQRHGEALAFRSMAINASSTLMPLLFGAAGTVVGAALLFWAVGGVVGAGAWLARGLASVRQGAPAGS